MSALVTDHLPLLATAPDGIKKLRGLILELAVRGKLVPQDPNDEPASELLKRIAEEKTRLVAEGKVKKQKLLAHVEDEDKQHDLPSGWEWVRLGTQVVESGAGWSPNCEPRPRLGNEWGVIKVSAVSWGAFNPRENKALPNGVEPRPEYEVADGDFLVSRANTAELVARSVVVDAPPPHLMLSDKIVRLKLTSLCDQRYVNLANSSPYSRNYYSRVAGGTSVSMKNVSREQILNLPIQLPPVAEQQRIVTKVDELMALCNRLEAQQDDAAAAHAQLVQTLLDSLTLAQDAVDFAASWQRLSAHFDVLFTTEASIDALKQAILQLAVMGKLVPQDPNDEPASGLLKRISGVKERLVAEGRISKQKTLPAVSEEERSCDLPKTWAWCRLQDAFDVRDGTHDTPKYQRSGFPLVTSKNLYTGRLDFSDVKLISEEDHRKISVRSKVDRGDVLFAMIGSIGNPVIVDTDISFSIKNVALVKQYSPGLMSERYLLQYLLVAAADMREKASGAVQSFVSLGSIRLCPFAVPPLSEQHRIVAKVDELMAFCDQIKTQLSTAHQLHEKLAGALVEQAVA